MRGTESTWRKAKITPKFITAKAIALMALRRGIRPVSETGLILKRCKDIVVFGDLEYISPRMFREALNELEEQGFAGAVGDSYSYYWWSTERLV